MGAGCSGDPASRPSCVRAPIALPRPRRTASTPAMNDVESDPAPTTTTPRRPAAAAGGLGFCLMIRPDYRTYESATTPVDEGGRVLLNHGSVRASSGTRRRTA